MTALSAHLALIPAILVVLGVGSTLFGWSPRLLGAFGWLAVAFIALTALFGPVLNFPGWLMGLSPFEHLAAVPAEPFVLLPYGLLLVFTAGGIAAALIGSHRREIHAS